MDLFLAISQALGLGLACGIGGPPAAAFVAAMAAAGAGIDPEATDWSFLTEPWAIVVLVAASPLAAFAGARSLPLRWALALTAALVGAVAGAASLAEEGEAAAFGLVAGAFGGAAASLLTQDVLAGARKRADTASGAAAGAPLALIAAVAGVAVAAAALFGEPSSLLVAAGLVWVAVGRHRRAGEKYEGLRTLR